MNLPADTGTVDTGSARAHIPHIEGLYVERIPIGKVAVPGVRWDDEGNLSFFDDEVAQVDLPDGLNVDLADLDLDDDAVLHRFIKTYGMLWEPEGAAIGWPAWIRAANPDLFAEPVDPMARNHATLSLFRRHARLIRALVNHWDLVRHPDPNKIREPWEREGFTIPAGEVGRLHAWDLFRVVLRIGVASFAGDLLIVHPDYPERRDAEQPVPLFDALCAMQRNHVIERLPYKRCANEKCDRVFVRQEGGQRTDEVVRYCSNRCATAQAKRVYRRRQKENNR